MKESQKGMTFRRDVGPLTESLQKREILIIEDDQVLRAHLEKILHEESLVTTLCGDGFSALDLIYTRRFSLIILDLGLPDLSGSEVAKRIRHDSLNRSTPIMILSARSQETDIVYGFGIGADDYVVKPIRAKELIARVHMHLAKKTALSLGIEGDGEYWSRHGWITIDRVEQKIAIDQNGLSLSSAEYRVFEALLDAEGQSVSRNDIISALTLGSFHVSERNIDVHIKNIRRKLGPKRELLQTIRGFGYRLVIGDSAKQSGISMVEPGRLRQML